MSSRDPTRARSSSTRRVSSDPVGRPDVLRPRHGPRRSAAAARPSAASSLATHHAPHGLAHPHRVGPRQRLAAVGHLLHGPHREGRAGAEAVGEPARLGEQLVAGHDPSGEPDLGGAGGVDALAREQQLERGLHPDAAREPDGADDRRHAEAHLGHPELGVVGREHEVAGGDERQAVAEAVAVHGGDRRLPDLEPRLEGVDGRDLPERARPAGPPSGRRRAGRRRRRTRARRRSRSRPTPRSSSRKRSHAALRSWRSAPLIALRTSGRL